MQLSPELESKVCSCVERFNNSGWGLDESTGYWVHLHHFLKGAPEPCGKPSRFCAIWECDDCDKEFFAATPPEDVFFGVLCPECS